MFHVFEPCTLRSVNLSAMVSLHYPYTQSLQYPRHHPCEPVMVRWQGFCTCSTRKGSDAPLARRILTTENVLQAGAREIKGNAAGNCGIRHSRGQICGLAAARELGRRGVCKDLQQRMLLRLIG
jgi:hypothetical protein